MSAGVQITAIICITIIVISLIGNRNKERSDKQ